MVMFNKDIDPPEGLEENMCHVCRASAHEAYRMSCKVPGDQQEKIFQHYFYSTHNEHYDSVVERLLDGDTSIAPAEV